MITWILHGYSLYILVPHINTCIYEPQLPFQETKVLQYVTTLIQDTLSGIYNLANIRTWLSKLKCHTWLLCSLFYKFLIFWSMEPTKVHNSQRPTTSKNFISMCWTVLISVLSYIDWWYVGSKNIEIDRFQWHAVHTQSWKLIMQ